MVYFTVDSFRVVTASATVQYFCCVYRDHSGGTIIVEIIVPLRQESSLNKVSVEIGQLHNVIGQKEFRPKIKFSREEKSYLLRETETD